MLFYVNLKGNNYFVTLSPMHQKRHNFLPTLTLTRNMKLSTIATAVALALTWTTSLKAEEAPAKKGLSFVPFQMLAYDGAKGFLVGGRLNVYDFGNGDSELLCRQIHVILWI